MMASPPRLLLLAGLLLTLPGILMLRHPSGVPQSSSQSPTPTVPGLSSDDQKKLEQAIQREDTPALDEFFRRRTPDEAARKRIRLRILQLGSESFAERHEALRELAARGPGVAALLRAARHHSDPEIAARATELLESNPTNTSTALVVAAVRQLSEKPSERSLTVLLHYAGWTEDETVAGAVQTGVAKLARSDPAHVVVLAKALGSTDPGERAVAGAALAQTETRAHWPAVRKLLADPILSVRTTIARALLLVHDREAVAVLIDGIPEQSDGEVWELLDRFSVLDKTPTVGPGTDASGRKRCRDAWAAWWRSQGPKVDLEALARRLRLQEQRLLLLSSAETAQIVFVDQDRKVRGRLEGLNDPVSVHWLADKRILIAEYQGKRVCELDTKNDAVWSHDPEVPVVSAQRLPEDSTLIASRKRIFKVDSKGKQTWTYSHPTRAIAGARPRSDGGVVFLTDDGVCVALNAKGEEESRFATGVSMPLGCGFDVLGNGCVVVPCFGADRVQEFDPHGNLLWQAVVPQPTCVRRLPGGLTLVGSRTNQKVVEIDRQGTHVWKYTAEGRVVGVDRR